MSLLGRRVFNALTLYSVGRVGLKPINTQSCAVRLLSVTSHCRSKSQRSPGANEDDELSQPIKFTTSKGSHRSWKVERSMGSRHQRPWWKVLPLALLCSGFLLWCVFRDESEIDRELEKQLYEHLPGLLTDTEEEAEETGTLEKTQKTG